MPGKTFTPEQIIAKQRQIEALMSQDKTRLAPFVTFNSASGGGQGFMAASQTHQVPPIQARPLFLLRPLAGKRRRPNQSEMATRATVVQRNRPVSRACLLGAMFCALLWAQLPVPKSNPASAQPEADALGRGSPRGTVLGFLSAARKGDMHAASQYLNTSLQGKAAQRLAEQVYTVLDRRLPTRLLALSDAPEGSLSTFRADQDLIGRIPSDEGDVDILVERVTGSTPRPIWLFSKKTLGQIPALFAELTEEQVDAVLPPILFSTRIAGIALFNWIGVFVGLPAVYYFTVLLNRLLSLLVGWVRRRVLNLATTFHADILPTPVRLLLIALMIYWMIAKAALPLIPRQVWSIIAALIVIAACTWGIILINVKIEKHIRRRLVRAGQMGTSSAVRLFRRAADSLVIFIGLLAAAYLLGFNPTTALAGLGIGGIAIALAAQKTLENVLGGVSIIFDQTVRVGDFLQVGEIIGEIEQIGLRSTKVRTRERSLVSIPNGLLATLSLENCSSKDKFWFHPNVRLRYDTTAAQMRSILETLESLLAQNPRVEPNSIHVRLLGFGTSSLELEVFAYVMTRDRLDFLKVQQDLLLQVMGTVEAAGAQIALQSPVYVAPTSVPSAAQLAAVNSEDLTPPQRRPRLS